MYRLRSGSKVKCQGGDINIAIVGGGATGVELASELTRMIDLAGGLWRAHIHDRLRLTLLESAPRILSAFPEAVVHLGRIPVARARRARAHPE
jgi:NADH dehydrogenase FAD-containing subunit